MTDRASAKRAGTGVWPFVTGRDGRRLGLGASGWEYYVPFRPDLDAALQALKSRVLADGEYWWPFDEVDEDEDDDLPPDWRVPRPRTLAEFGAVAEANEDLQSEGTHSILDMDHVKDRPYAMPGTVRPVSADEAREVTGKERLTRADVPLIEDLADERWIGRCAVLHDERGEPSEIYFWGFSGD